MLMQCDGWLAGLELVVVLGWENAEAKEKKGSTNRPTAPDGDETCFGGGGGDATVVWFFLFRVKSAEAMMGPKFARL
jgi:hypothetical protein